MSIIDAEDLPEVYTSFPLGIISLSQLNHSYWHGYPMVELEIHCWIQERANLRRSGRWKSIRTTVQGGLLSL